jgi:hypothetical protein
MDNQTLIPIVLSVLTVLMTAAVHISISARREGRIEQKLDSLQSEITEHKGLPIPRAHAQNGGPRPP